MRIVNTRYVPKTISVKIPDNNPREKMLTTIKLIGQAIRSGSRYLPIRNHAAALATLAGPKDYLGQVKQIYNDAIRRWRYVNDPFGVELLSFGPKALSNFVLGLDGYGVGRGRGAGDCDCITAAIGAELMSIGRPVRIAVTAPTGARPGSNFSHVFIQAYVPKTGWVTVDPVLHPERGLGATTNFSRIAYFSLSGNLINYHGNVVW